MIAYPNVKVNLGLNVLRKREDGFHDIETLFVPFDGLYDNLEIVESSRFQVEIENGEWNPDEDLTAKAYQLMKEEFDLPPVEIYLEKQVPVGAGLGGGSSDAAFTLRLLNEMFGLKLSDKQLAERAAKLGSDCAFFIYNEPMIGEGKGDILTPYDISFEGYYVDVITPEIEVSTAEAYAGIVPAVPAVSLRDALARPVGDWKDVLKNDFESTIFKKYPDIAQIKKDLYDEGAVYAAMSGSGSAVFGIFKQ